MIVHLLIPCPLIVLGVLHKAGARKDPNQTIRPVLPGRCLTDHAVSEATIFRTGTEVVLLEYSKSRREWKAFRPDSSWHSMSWVPEHRLKVWPRGLSTPGP